jgi:short-subunit dehydrogenase
MITKKNKTAWITGGGSGIGKELTKALCKAGFNVVISGRGKKKLIETARYNTKKIFAYQLDVSNSIQSKKVCQKILNRFGFIDLIILNAAIYSPGSLKNLLPSEAKKVIDVNLIGVLNCLSPILKLMKLKNNGQIVFVSSPAGYQGLPGGGFYGVTKSALTFLAETLRIELVDKNIKVQVVHPGFVKTAMTDKNPFHMPFLMEPKIAANKIFQKLKSNDFEIYFPKKLIIPMKLLRLLPYKMYFFIMKHFIKVPK